MNRRSMLKAAIGACAAMLFPWGKAQAKPWAYVVAFVPGDAKYKCPDGTLDQTKRIERLLESRYQKTKRLKKQVRRPWDCDVVAYEMFLRRVPWTTTTAISLRSRSGEAFVYIDDAVAESTGDSDLYCRLLDAFLTAIPGKQKIANGMDKTSSLRHVFVNCDGTRLFVQTHPYRPTEENTG